MKIIVAVAAICCSFQVFSQSNRIDLFIRGKALSSFEVLEINSKGILSTSEKFANYRIIDSLHVYDDNLRDQICSFLETEIVIGHTSYTTINLTQCVFPVIISEDHYVFSSSIVGLRVSSHQGTLAGFNLDSKLNEFPGFFVRLDFSTGFYDKENPLLSSINLGGAIGYKLGYLLHPQLFIGYGSFSGKVTSPYARSFYYQQQRVYLNFALEFQLLELDWLSQTLGVNYFHDPVFFYNKETSLIYCAGVNIVLRQ